MMYRLVVVGYLGLVTLLLLVYFLSSLLPETQSTLAKLLSGVSLNLCITSTISFGSYFLISPLVANTHEKYLEDFHNKTMELLTLEK
jgi:hypothetical protein